MSTDDVTRALTDAAHDYRNRGWRVIQLHSVGPDGKTCSCRRGGNCSSAGKHPRRDEWQNTEPYSAADIETLWSERPKANLGIATGEPSGLWVLDIDPKHGGLGGMKALIDEHGALPATFTVQTGSGGYHYYFALPDFVVKNDQSGRVAQGVDVRGQGGQVVAPPSRSDIGPYTVLRDAPLAQAPAWLLKKVRKDEPTAPKITAAELPKPEEISEAEWNRLNAYASRAIEAEKARLRRLAETGWDGEPWNHTTFEVSCSLIEFGNSPWCSYSTGQAQADVLECAPRDNQGFDTWTVEKTFRSALERVGDKARPVPENRSAEPDPLFNGPDVRVNPTQGGGEQTTPVVGHGGPDRFFDPKEGLLTQTLTQAVLDLGPIGYGRDLGFWEYDHGVWKPNRTLLEDRAIDLLGNRYRPAHVATITGPVRKRAFKLEGDPTEGYMNFANGMLDWQTGEVLAHDANFKSTIQFPIAWNPEAECPIFDQFLADVMHADYVDLAWEMIGYLMMSGNPLQVAFLLYGSGGNGKGTLVRVLQDILGLENVASEPLDRLNGDRFSAVNLYGKIANIAGDIDATYQESTAAFKRLTGEDEIAAERKFGDRFVFRNWAVPLFSANKIPGSSDVTEGYLRRWVVLHFHKRITDPTPGLSNLLATEVEGIAAKAVPALRRLMERRKFDPQGEAVKAKQEFAEAIDQVRQWVGSGEVQQAPDHQAPVVELFAAYSIWAQRTNRGRVNETEFSHRLEAIGYPLEVVAGARYHNGLKVPTHSHQPQSPASFF